MYLSDPRAKRVKKTLDKLHADLAALFGDDDFPFTKAAALHLQDTFGAKHYSREQGLVLDHAEGCFVWDTAGKKYLDCIATYSAIASGHGNIELIAAALKQLSKMTSAPNRFINDTQPRLLKEIAFLTSQDGVILMNTGAEAIDTAIKGARRWAYRKKGVPENKAVVISAHGNFHGRTLNAVGLSATDKYRLDFGPFPEGYAKVPYGDIEALRAAITPNTAAFIVEPIQGEGGIVLPPQGYLKAVRELCTKENVLLIFDEIQTGLGRTGLLFGAYWSGVHPDGVVLGKALGQYVAVSAFAARKDVMDCFDAGSHGSTFGGTALPCAVALKSLELIRRDNYALVRNSLYMGNYFSMRLRMLKSTAIKEVRGKGLFIGVEFDSALASPDVVCSKLLENGLMAGVAQKTVRFTPPLVITSTEVDLAVEIIAKTVGELSHHK